MSDATWHDHLRLIGEDYLRLADDKVWLARRQAEFWAQVARLEQQQAARLDWRRPAKTPSGTFTGVQEALAPIIDHSRALTEKKDLTALAEAAEAEFRITPLRPDARKEPEE